MGRSLCLVLTSAPGSRRLTGEVAKAALGAIEGASIKAARWLAPAEAWEVSLDVLESVHASAVRDAAQRAIGSAAVDVNVIAGDSVSRRKRLLCADMESTIIEQELIDELGALAGRHEEISAITRAAMRGELDFATSLVQRVALFAGIDAGKLDALFDRVTLMPGAETLIRAMQARGAKSALISGGFTIFAERVGAHLGFDAVVANTLEIEGGKLTGRVKEPILGPQGKADALLRLAADDGIDVAETIAVGDGSNDTAMLATAGIGVAFRAKPILEAAARASETGAVIRHGDLTSLLYLQGIPHDALTD
jgi:phosphoserine phosphatase